MTLSAILSLVTLFAILTLICILLTFQKGNQGTSVLIFVALIFTLVWSCLYNVLEPGYTRSSAITRDDIEIARTSATTTVHWRDMYAVTTDAYINNNITDSDAIQISVDSTFNHYGFFMHRTLTVTPK